MKNTATYISALMLSLALMGPSPSMAADCNAAAQQVSASTGGEIINVVARGDDCDITVRVPGKNGKPPRVVTKTVKG